MILANDLKRQYDMFADEYEKKALSVLRSGWYILGNEVKAFEEEWADYIGTNYCVGLASGLDALCIAFKMLGIHEGDEVIVSSNAYIACVMGITKNGATPVFVEPDEFFNIDVEKIEAMITTRTKAILAVHLFGQACNMNRIMEIARKYELFVVEDCAQSHGNSWDGKKVGAFGDIGCFSFYPTKGCGAFGDGGCIVTNSESIANRCRGYRNYGSIKKYYNEEVGCNSRLDELQAGLLRVKLKHLDKLNDERRELAEYYLNRINNQLVVLPKVPKEADSTWHQFVVRCAKRDELIDWLKNKDIGSAIHYPIPPHLSKAYNFLGKMRGSYPIAEKMADEVLSIPMYNGMTRMEQDKVIDALNEFS